MAALDLSGSPGPVKTARASLEASAANAREVKLPKWARKFTCVFKTSANADDAGKLCGTGTDAAAIGTDVFPVPSGSALEIKVEPIAIGTRSIFLSGDAGGGYAYIILEAKA